MDTERRPTSSPQPQPKGNRERSIQKSELIDLIISEMRDGGELFGPERTFTKLKGAVMERLLETELSEHLGSAEGEPAGDSGKNGRNGFSEKTVQTETGPVRIRVPRDRAGTFQPQVIKKHQHRVEGFDEKVLAIYARGMSVRDIQGHLRELYGTEVSPELISKATDAVLPEFRDWQMRPLDALYPVVYLDKALQSAFPRAVFQTCAVHLIRSAMRFVGWARPQGARGRPQAPLHGRK